MARKHQQGEKKMGRTLENERLLIEVEERGSQLVRIYDKKKDREVPVRHSGRSIRRCCSQ